MPNPRFPSALRPVWPLLFLALPWPPLGAWSPGTSQPSAAGAFAVNTADRRDVLAFYQTIYRASLGAESRMAWTGNITSGAPGTTSAAFKEDIRRRINFYRALCGLPADITFNDAKSAKCQEAALMFSRNNNISHNPPSSWIFYTANASEAAGKSNLSLGSHGPAAVDGYIYDAGAHNAPVGHRRWILYSRAAQMGTGDVPPTPGYPSSNALWVIGDFLPSAPAQFVAWPNAGFCPAPLAPARWSLSHPGANFGAATVSMTFNGANIPLTVVSRTDNGYGDNTIVWEPSSLPGPAGEDRTFQVHVSGIGGSGVPGSVSYSVTLFDPDNLAEFVTISGPSSPPASGAAYTFNPIAQADAYELRVAGLSSASWAEGAEESPAPKILDQTSGLTLRQTAVKRSGARAFQLAFPEFDPAEQGFEIDRDVIPSPSSQLVFYDLFRWLTSTCRLSAELSEDGGLTWIEIWGRNGSGATSSTGWDPSFNTRSVSLAAWNGKPVRIRFVLRHQNSIFIGTGSDYGVFLDDISITHSQELIVRQTTALSGNATGFTLDSTTAGGPLAPGETMAMSIRPLVGTKWFGHGPLLTVTPSSASGFAAFAAAQTPPLSGNPSADQDGDGLPDLVEYAFGTGPNSPTPSSAIPQPVLQGNTLVLEYAAPSAAAGVVFGAEWSEDLTTWHPLPNTGPAGVMRFVLSLDGRPRAFMRHKLRVAP